MGKTVAVGVIKAVDKKATGAGKVIKFAQTAQKAKWVFWAENPYPETSPTPVTPVLVVKEQPQNYLSQLAI